MASRIGHDEIVIEKMSGSRIVIRGSLPQPMLVDARPSRGPRAFARGGDEVPHDAESCGRCTIHDANVFRVVGPKRGRGSNAG